MGTAWRAFAMSEGGGKARSGLGSSVALSKIQGMLWGSMEIFTCSSWQ